MKAFIKQVIMEEYGAWTGKYEESTEILQLKKEKYSV